MDMFPLIILSWIAFYLVGKLSTDNEYVVTQAQDSYNLAEVYAALVISCAKNRKNLKLPVQDLNNDTTMCLREAKRRLETGEVLYGDTDLG